MDDIIKFVFCKDYKNLKSILDGNNNDKYKIEKKDIINLIHFLIYIHKKNYIDDDLIFFIIYLILHLFSFKTPILYDYEKRFRF